MIENFEEEQVQHLKRNCPICQTEYGSVLGCLKYTLFDESYLNDTFNVVCCNKCGFVFYDTTSSQNDYDCYYENSFYSSTYINRKIDFNEMKYVTQTLNNLSQYIINKNISIFDIGCGTGLLLKKLNTLGYKNLYGIDPSLSCVNLLNKNKKIQTKIGSLSNIPFNNIKADVIILSHIIEHVIDLQLAFKNINDKISDNGLIYVEVPNTLNYNISNSPIRFFYPQHVNHFDVFSLNNLFENNGYIKIKNGCHLRIEGDLSMPCIWGIYRKDNSLNTNNIFNIKNMSSNFNLTQKIKKWFNNISFSTLDNDNILINLANSNKSVYIWGIGIHTQMMLSMSPLKNCNIKCFVDSDKRNHKKTIKDKKIYPIDILYNATEHDTVFIGAPTHNEVMYNELVNKIKFKGNIIICRFEDIFLATDLSL